MKAPKNKYFQKYVADSVLKRLEELGMSQYKFLKENPETTTEMTLRRIVRGDCANVATIVHYCDLLGLEIIIQPKK